MSQRREALGRLAEACVIVEGGPATDHEARVAAAAGSLLVPVGRSGGCAGALWSSLVCPSLAKEPTWHTLNDPNASPTRVAASVFEIVSAYARRGARPQV
jgi:hypothetical protein